MLDIVLVSGKPDDLKMMTEQYHAMSQIIGLKMNTNLTKTISAINIQLTNEIIENVDEYIQKLRRKYPDWV